MMVLPEFHIRRQRDLKKRILWSRVHNKIILYVRY